MRTSFRSLASLAWLLAVACHPIVIGSPGEAEGGSGPSGAGVAGLSSAGAPAIVAGAPGAGAAGSLEAVGGGSGAGSSGATSAGGTGCAAAGIGAEACDTSPIAARALVVALDPIVTSGSGQPQRLSATFGANEPEALVLQLIEALRESTAGHVRLETSEVMIRAEFPQLVGGFRYTAATYAACQLDAKKCRPEGADYAALELEQQLCSAAEQTRTDEIWLLVAPHFGFSALSSLECHLLVDGADTVKQVDVVGLNYGRGASGFLADFQARSDTALLQAFAAPPAEFAANPYGVFRQSYPIEPKTAQPATCSAWGCTEDGYRSYWFLHLPKARWLDQTGKYNDFWRYVFFPDERLALPPVSVDCSSSYLPGWCEHVRDGKHGECNSDEWATNQQSTGWVEFSYAPKQLVTGIQLYDRACDERVLSGHLEFSDGSPNQPFGALDDTGKQYLTVKIDPKLLSGLRVVIDESQGPHPGFGEITVSTAQP